jgi:hypothetical protein
VLVYLVRQRSREELLVVVRGGVEADRQLRVAARREEAARLGHAVSIEEVLLDHLLDAEAARRHRHRPRKIQVDRVVRVRLAWIRV